ncbi:MAG: DUF2185 domain-containing protein [Xanthomonadales bacterium]|nr:DUF2185 domain-containing protein [Xanthomonadales bacterium]
MSDSEEIGMDCAAIVCGHVARLSAVILCAQRDLPEEPADSGWQFLCGAEEEDWTEAQVWSVAEVLELIPNFSEFLHLPADSVLTRKDPSSTWDVEK